MQPRPGALGYLWRHHRAGLVGLGIAVVIAAAFAVRLVIFTLHWSDPSNREQAPAGWMTPGYVAQSWDVPPDVIRAVLAAPTVTRPGAHLTLAQIAEAEGVPLPVLIARVEAAIAAARAE